MTKKAIESLVDLVYICKKYNMFTVVLYWESHNTVDEYLPAWTRIEIEKQQDRSRINYIAKGTSGGGLGPETHFREVIDLKELVNMITEDIPSNCLRFTITVGMHVYELEGPLLGEIMDIRKQSVMEYLTSKKII